MGSAKTKHTPGPWEHQGNLVLSGSAVVHHQPDLIHHRVLGGGFGEYQANARLIAAAPDMAEALNAAKFFLLENVQTKEASHVIATLDAALKKAGVRHG